MYILSLYYRNINLDVFSVFLLHCGYKIVKGRQTGNGPLHD